MRKPKRRCALYTRKSSEEGLEQEFNSLDAQRDACAAYVQSQACEGWRVIRTDYDDGGYSGGSMERPALQRLLADIASGKIDVVVVYKIDRLTRSLADFARIVECFDRHEVSFVSVTQAFNTTSSMGRLMLNVLLSFAQFEREVTGERIRDKIRASKAKGMWMGGVPPLGYDIRDKKLVVNEAEADTARNIFETYLQLGSVHALERDLDERGIRSKQRITKSGRQSGGKCFSRGALFHLLRNRLYLGLIVHKGEAHPGLQSAIVSSELFEAVQHALDAQTRRHADCRNPVEHAPLTGRLFDADGQRMSPTFSYGRGGKLYRYYVSAPLQQGKRPTSDDQIIRRVPAAALEDQLVDVIKRLLPAGSEDPLDHPTRVEVHPQNLQVLLPIQYLARIRGRLGEDEQADQDPADPSQLRLMVPGRLKARRGGRTSVIEGAEPAVRPDPA
ncbi:MAG: recombinase family protein, partial [Geminicoccaceae bacterium]